MNLKNYTSSVPADTTVARIERQLADAGVSGIQKLYEKGRVVAILFAITFDTSRPPVTVRLPANIEACLEAFWQEYRANRGPRSNKTREEFRGQAEMTAWKIQQDWVEVCLSLIRLKQVTFMQAFLPYVWDGQATFYEKLSVSGFKGLLPPPQPQP